MRTSKARAPSSTGTPPTSKRRWRSSTRKRPNSSGTSLAAGLARRATIGEPLCHRLTPGFCHGERRLHDVALLEHTVARIEQSSDTRERRAVLEPLCCEGNGFAVLHRPWSAFHGGRTRLVGGSDWSREFVILDGDYREVVR